MNKIEINKLNKKYDDFQVLKDIDLTVKNCEVISIIGPSGSGKSTLLRVIQGLEKEDSGTIIIDESKNLKEIHKKIGMVFQNFNLFPHKTVLENIMEAPIIVNKMNKKDAKILSLDLLQKVGLLDKKFAYPNKLSGGQKQRVAIARALAMKPEILLFDEPTSALDPELVGEVLNVIKELAKEKITMIIVTHEMNFAKEVSDYVVFMDNGEIIEKNIPIEIFEKPRNKRVKEFISKII